MVGRDPSILETNGKLQILQPIAAPTTAEGSLNPGTGSRIYVGITAHPSHRLGIDKGEKKEKEKNMAQNDNGIEKDEKGKNGKENKSV